MSRTIPMIRAAVAGPILQWLIQNNRPVDRILENSEFSFLSLDNPLQAVPVHSVAKLLSDLSESEGPDLPSRIIQETGDVSLAMMGPFAISATSPGEALNRVGAALPYFSSHEHLSLERTNTGGIIRQFWGTTFDRETLHYLHQFVCALLELVFSQSTAAKFGVTRIELIPHPTAGLDFLRPRFQSQLCPGTNVLSVYVTKEALNLPFRNFVDVSKTPPPLPDLQSLRGEGGLVSTVKITLRAMLESGKPSVERLAQATGVSRRTFQRLMQQEGTNYSSLLAEVKYQAALDWIELDEGNLGELSSALGYSDPSGLTRAMRKWAGASPRDVAKRSKR